MSRLAQFRVEGDSLTGADLVDPLPLPQPEPLVSGLVLSFDQQLANSGWVLVRGNADREWQDPPFVVLATGHIKTAPGNSGGFEDSLARGAKLFGAYTQVIEDTDPDFIVHELPNVRALRATRSRNREAGIVAATALRCAASVNNHRVVMVGAQHVRKLLCGSTAADKKDVREAVKRLTVGWESQRPLNEHVYDAIGLAVAGLCQEKP